MSKNTLEDPPEPLKVEEVIGFCRKKWGVTYELRILVKGENIFLHIMWRYLEQKSFIKNEQEFKDHLSEKLDVINRLGQASFVRNWLLHVKGRPKGGKALSLRLRPDYRLKEFVL